MTRASLGPHVSPGICLLLLGWLCGPGCGGSPKAHIDLVVPESAGPLPTVVYLVLGDFSPLTVRHRFREPMELVLEGPGPVAVQYDGECPLAFVRVFRDLGSERLRLDPSVYHGYFDYGFLPRAPSSGDDPGLPVWAAGRMYCVLPVSMGASNPGFSSGLNDVRATAIVAAAVAAE